MTENLVKQFKRKVHPELEGQRDGERLNIGELVVGSWETRRDLTSQHHPI